MNGVDAGGTLDVYNGDGGDEIEVEALVVDLLHDLHDDDVGEVLVDGVDDTGELEDR